MGTKIINKDYCPNSTYYRSEYICDTDADFANLPVANIGSTALSIASGRIMIVNTQGEWVAFAE